MTTQQKIKAIERRLYKVQFSMNTKKVVCVNIGASCTRGITCNSISEAYNKIVKKQW